MTAVIGRSFCVVGSACTPKFSNAVAPRRNSELGGPNTTKQVIVSSLPSIENAASPTSRRSFLPSANTKSGELGLDSNRAQPFVRCKTVQCAGVDPERFLKRPFRRLSAGDGDFDLKHSPACILAEIRCGNPEVARD